MTDIPFDSESEVFEKSVEGLADAVLMAYHEGEIREAVDRLPSNQRTYVLDRFWRQYPNPNRYLWGKARTALSKDLEHLKETV